MRVRWDRVVAVLLLIGLAIFLAVGGLAALPHMRVGIAVPQDPVVALATLGVIAATLIAVTRLLTDRHPN